MYLLMNSIEAIKREKYVLRFPYLYLLLPALCMGGCATIPNNTSSKETQPISMQAIGARSKQVVTTLAESDESSITARLDGMLAKEPRHYQPVQLKTRVTAHQRVGRTLYLRVALDSNVKEHFPGYSTRWYVRGGEGGTVESSVHAIAQAEDDDHVLVRIAEWKRSAHSADTEASLSLVGINRRDNDGQPVAYRTGIPLPLGRATLNKTTLVKAMLGRADTKLEASFLRSAAHYFCRISQLGAGSGPREPNPLLISAATHLFHMANHAGANVSEKELTYKERKWTQTELEYMMSAGPPKHNLYAGLQYDRIYHRQRTHPTRHADGSDAPCSKPSLSIAKATEATRESRTKKATPTTTHTTSTEDVAAYVPRDMAMLKANSIAALQHSLQALSLRLSKLLGVLNKTPLDHWLLEPYERQLATRFLSVVKTHHIADGQIALITSDVDLRLGIDLSILYPVSDDSGLHHALEVDHTMLPSDVTLKSSTRHFHGIPITIERADTVGIRRYTARVGNIFVLSNSMNAIKQIILTHDGKLSSLSQNPNYQDASKQDQLEHNDARTALLFAGRSFFVRRSTRAWQIGRARSVQARADLRAINHAALTVAWLDGRLPKTLRAFKPGGIVRMPKTRHGDNSQIKYSPHMGAYSLFGTAALGVPLRDNLPRCMAEEETWVYRNRMQDGLSSQLDKIGPVALSLHDKGDNKMTLELNVDWSPKERYDVDEFLELLMVPKSHETTVGTDAPSPPIATGKGLQLYLSLAAKNKSGLGQTARQAKVSGILLQFIGTDVLTPEIRPEWLGKSITLGIEDSLPILEAAALKSGLLSDDASPEDSPDDAVLFRRLPLYLQLHGVNFDMFNNALKDALKGYSSLAPTYRVERVHTKGSDNIKLHRIELRRIGRMPEPNVTYVAEYERDLVLAMRPEVAVHRVHALRRSVRHTMPPTDKKRWVSDHVLHYFALSERLAKKEQPFVRPSIGMMEASSSQCLICTLLESTQLWLEAGLPYDPDDVFQGKARAFMGHLPRSPFPDAQWSVDEDGLISDSFAGNRFIERGAKKDVRSYESMPLAASLQGIEDMQFRYLVKQTAGNPTLQFQMRAVLEME